MKKIIDNKSFFAVLLLCIFFFSCSQKKEIGLLQQAQAIVESDPQKALSLLESIPNPQDMDKEHYMQYIVAHVQAKYKCYKDITNDTLIFEAHQYFEHEKNYNQAALASLYSGNIYFDKQRINDALHYFLEAEKYAKQSRNNLIIARSLHSIAHLYFQQNTHNKTIEYYTNALEYYNKVQNSDIYKFQSIHFIGRAYETLNTLDSSLVYYNNGLEIAKEKENEYYQALFMQSLGVIFHKKDDYKQSLDYLHDALILTKNVEDSLRVYLNLALVYNSTRQTDSTKYYADLLKERISEIKYKPTLRTIYSLLVDYNQQIGNNKEALHYKALHSDIDKQIQKTSHSDELTKANNKHLLSLKDKEAEAQRKQFLYLIALILCVAVIVFLWFRQKHQKQIERNKLLETRNTLLEKEAKSYMYLKGIFQPIITEWRKIDQKIYQMAIQYKATEKPEIFAEIEHIVISVQEQTNKQLIEWGKNNLDVSIISTLNNKELLYFMLRSSGVSTEDIYSTFPFSSHQEQSCNNYKYIIRKKLARAGILTPEIETLLLGENSNILNHKPPAEPYQINL